MEHQSNSFPDDEKYCEFSFVMPCLNESETLAKYIDKAHAFLERHNISGEIIVADNGSKH